MNESISKTTSLPNVRKVGLGAPFDWLAGGWSDFLAAPLPCLIYGSGLGRNEPGFYVGSFLFRKLQTGSWFS